MIGTQRALSRLRSVLIEAQDTERLRRAAADGDMEAAVELQSVRKREGHRSTGIIIPLFTAKAKNIKLPATDSALMKSSFYGEARRYLWNISDLMKKAGVPKERAEQISTTVEMAMDRGFGGAPGVYHTQLPGHAAYTFDTQTDVARYIKDVLPQEVDYIIASYSSDPSTRIGNIVKAVRKLTNMQAVLAFAYKNDFPSRLDADYASQHLQEHIEKGASRMTQNDLDEWEKSILQASRVNV